MTEQEVRRSPFSRKIPPFNSIKLVSSAKSRSRIGPSLQETSRLGGTFCPDKTAYCNLLPIQFSEQSYSIVTVDRFVSKGVVQTIGEIFIWTEDSVGEEIPVNHGTWRNTGVNVTVSFDLRFMIADTFYSGKFTELAVTGGVY